MGPVQDQQGLEQGGISSSNLYKIFGKEQLTMAQDSNLGVPLGDSTISAVGQADDTALVSNNLNNLQYLLKLSEAFCTRSEVKLSPNKTKLQVFFTKNMSDVVRYAMITNPVKLNKEQINFSINAEHVGILRSSTGNQVTILARITQHRKALHAVLHAGLARSHRSNPTASLAVACLYCLPVLLSGLAPLVMTKSEESLVENHQKETILNLQRLLPRTPAPVIYFLAGSLPGRAHLHLRKLTIFGMICRMTSNFLHSYALNLFQHGDPPFRSWFYQVLDLCKKYSLPTPLELLQNPLQKSTYKKLIKNKVIDHCERELRAEAAPLSSLVYFRPQYMSLVNTHPLWSSAGSSPSKVTMATVQAHMLSGRYRTESLCSKWKPECAGVCLLSPLCSSTPEDLRHILQDCIALIPTRQNLLGFTRSYCENIPDMSSLVFYFLDPSNPEYCQFLIDCSTIPRIISAAQIYGMSYVHNHLFNITRTWIYTLHKERLKLLGRWNII